MYFIQIEGLHEDIDFRAKVTRAELEEICSDLLERVSAPIEQALEAADMTMVRMHTCMYNVNSIFNGSLILENFDFFQGGAIHVHVVV